MSVSKSPWTTVNDMLIQNRCWLCRDGFKKGKIKKVFMISQVLEYFELLQSKDTEKDAEIETEIESPNLKACYDQYCKTAGEVDRVLRDLEANDIAPWMSGLVCGQSEACAREFNMIVPNGTRAKPAATSKVASEILKKVDDCAPGCGCDNPWAFLS